MNKKQLKQNYWEVKDDGKLSTSEIVAKMREKFKVYVYDEENIDKDFPKPEKSTIRYFKKNVEADENLKNKSADDLEKEMVEGITLRERLILELQYVNETGKHLDVKNITLCSGSLSSDGGVPGVCWYDDCGYERVGVHWYCSDCRYESLRSREAVSLNSSSLIPCGNKEHLEAMDKLEKINETNKRRV